MILLTGAKGQLGGDVCSLLAKKNMPFLGVDIDALDITDEAAVAAFFETHAGIDAVIHCAAYTAVDKAEDDAEHCYAVNVNGTANLAKHAAECKFLYVSTDYVFGADGDLPLEVDAPKAPACVYGRTKLLGEEAVQRFCPRRFIVRTSGVFGEKDTNFIATILRLSETHDTLRVVNDQFGAPTYAHDLAALLVQMIATERYGVYHAANTGVCTWAELAETVLKRRQKTTTVLPVSTEDYGAKAKRPKNSRFSFRTLEAAGFSLLPPWQDAVERYLK